MAGPNIISSQSGVFTWNAVVGTTQDITITSVNTSRSWVRISIRAASTTTAADTTYTTATLTSSTNLRLQRGATGAAITVEWVVLEFDDSVNVYRGSFTQNSTTVDTTVTSVDLTKAISDCTFRTTTSVAATNNIRFCFIRNRLTSSTNLRTNAQASDSGSTVEWQVIEFTENVTVAMYEATFTTHPVNRTITSVDLDKSFLVFSWAPNAALTYYGEDILSCRFTSSTNVRMEDYFGGSVSKAYAFYVVSFTGSNNTTAKVERDYETITGFSITPTISADSSRSMVNHGHEYNSMIELSAATSNFDHFAVTCKLDSDVQFTAQRFALTYTGSVAWEVVQFPTSGEDVDNIVPRTMIHYYRQRSV